MFRLANARAERTVCGANVTQICRRPGGRLFKVPEMFKSHIEFISLGGVAQLGERVVRNDEVGSSILLLSTIFKARSFSTGLFHIWAFPSLCAVYVDSACATGPGRPATRRRLARLVSPFSALGSQKISENFASRAHAETLSRQALANEVLQ